VTSRYIPQLLFSFYRHRTIRADFSGGQITKRKKLFRAPGGVAWPRQLRLARERGYTCVLGCAYAHDPMRPPVKYIRWLIEKNLAPGTIVILHDGIKDATRSIDALPHILAEGKRRGLRFVSIGELIHAS
jgi:peptidoglycan/xylan/chitin deacetylase (PgdA/CDA1 family)